MGVTSITATMTKIGQLKDGVKVYTFTATDASAVNSAGASITLSKLKQVVGDPLLALSAATMGAAVLPPVIKSVTVSGNVIATTMNSDGSTTSVTYSGIVYGR